MKKYNHLLNLDIQRFVLLGGLPGAGKSTIAKDFEEAGYMIICPDTYRKIISKSIEGREHWTDSMHEGDQSLSAQAWDMAKKDAVKLFEEGKSIVFDALLSTKKARRKIVCGYGKAFYFSVYADTTLKTALKRNELRGENGGRFVPEFVIHDKWLTQIIPSKEEGFEEVVVVSELEVHKDITEDDRNTFLEKLINDPRSTITNMKEDGTLQKWFPSLYNCWGMSQDNSHHSLLLHEHMITAAELVEERSPELVITMLLHDVGKRNTKEFHVKTINDSHNYKAGEKLTIINKYTSGFVVQKRLANGVTQFFVPFSEVELDSNAHFYNHETVGAFDARRDLLNLGFNEDFANSVYKNIAHHMDLPYVLSSDKHMKKLINKVGEQTMKKLLIIRKADKMAGSQKPNFLDEHNKITDQVSRFIKGDA